MTNIAKFVSVAVALFVIAVTPALAVSSPAGTWQTADGSRFEVTLCGDGSEVCAKLVHLSGEAATPENRQYLDQYVLLGAKRALENKWRGQAEYLGELVKGTLTMVDPDTMTINGCKGALCQKFDLSRI